MLCLPDIVSLEFGQVIPRGLKCWAQGIWSTFPFITVIHKPDYYCYDENVEIDVNMSPKLYG